MNLQNVIKKLEELNYWSKNSTDTKLIARHDDFRNIELKIEGNKVVEFMVKNSSRNIKSKTLAKALKESAMNL